MNKTLHILLTAIALLPILLLAGCGTTASFEPGALPDNDWPKKRVMVMPAVDLTGIPSDESMDTIGEELTKLLGKTGFFDVYYYDKTEEFPLLKPGDPVDQQLMREAAEMGANVIIFETINPVETNSVSGIWLLRRKARRLTVSINIDIVDVNRGTILLCKEIAKRITIPDEEAEEETDESIDMETKKRAFRECLPDILERAAAEAGLSLNREVWTGRLVSTDEKRIVVNAGRDAGLRPGIVFEVFGEGERINSFKGQTYQLPGPKVGEIKIVSVELRRCLAEPVTEDGFKAGQIVRVRD